MSIPRADMPLPQGEEKAERCGDVRRDRPALRPREPGHDVPDGRRLATDDGRVARAATPVDRASTSRAAPATSAASCERGTSRPISVDLSDGHAARRPQRRAPLVQADVLRLPVRDGDVDGATCGFALRNLVDLPTFFAELARVVRPGGRVALLEVATPTNPLLRWGHGVYFGTVVPRIGARLSDGDAYRYLPRSVAYLPAPTELDLPAPRRGLPRRRHASRCRGASPSCCTGDPSLIASHACVSTADVDLLAVAGADGFLFEQRRRRASPARGVAARIRHGRRRGAPRGDHHEDEVGLPGCGPVAFGALPFTLTPDADLVVPEVVVGRDRRRYAVGDDDRRRSGAPTADIAVDPAAPRPGWAADVRITSSRDPAEWQAAVVTARRQASAAGALDKVVLARELRDRRRPSRSTSSACCARLRSSFPSSFVYSVDGFDRRHPRAAGVAARRRRALPPPGRHRAAQRRSRRSTRALAAALLGSTKDQLEHR